MGRRNLTHTKRLIAYVLDRCGSGGVGWVHFLSWRLLCGWTSMLRSLLWRGRIS